MKTICALTGTYEIDNERHFVKNHRSKHTFALHFLIFFQTRYLSFMMNIILILINGSDFEHTLCNQTLV